MEAMVVCCWDPPVMMYPFREEGVSFIEIDKR